MLQFLPLSPRYRLDDPDSWLEGIDPTRHYWVQVNGDPRHTVAIAGLLMTRFEQFRETMLAFRALSAGESLVLERDTESCTIYCISQNCYAIEMDNQSAPVWHLFDQETLDSLLMTGHPDWQCAPKDIDLGRRVLIRSWQQSVAA